MDAQSGAQARSVGLDTHSMDPVKVLAFARTLGAPAVHTLLVGCEPAVLGSGLSGWSDAGSEYEEMQMGLSDPVQAAVVEAAQRIDELVLQWYPTTSVGNQEKGK